MRSIFLLLIVGTLASGQEKTWTTYRGNIQRTGNNDGIAGPTNPAVLWFYKSEEHFVSAPVPVGDNIFFSTLGAFNRPRIMTFPQKPTDPKMIKPIWEKSVPTLKLPTVSSPAVVDNLIIFGEGMHQTDGASLYCFPAEGGYLLWQYSIPGTLVHLEGSPTASGRKVYMCGGSAGVFCLDMDSLKIGDQTVKLSEVPKLQAQKWKELQAKYEEEKKKDPDFAIPPTEDQLLKPTPKLVWQVGKDKWHVDASVLVVGDQVLVTSAFLDKEKLGDRAVYCLDAETGKQIWRAPLGLNPWGGCSVQGDTVVVTTSSISYDPKNIEEAKGEIYAFSLKDGKEKWKKSIPGGVLGAAALSDDAAIFSCTDGKVRSFALADGSRQMIYDAGAPLFASPALVKGVAYVADLKGVVHAVDVKSGKEVWKWDLAKDPSLPGMNYGGIIVQGGKLYLGTTNLEKPFIGKPTAAICIGSK